MAIVKFIAIHGAADVNNCINYVDDREKNTLEYNKFQAQSSSKIKDSNVSNVMDYSVNPEKTHLAKLDGTKVLVSGVNCSADFAKEAFRQDRDNYYEQNDGELKCIYDTKDKKKNPIDAYHVIQSFPSDVTDPELVHHLGILYAQKMFPNHKSIVSTHMNTEHLHNHIVVCAYEIDRPKKFKMNIAAINRMRAVNDQLSLSYGLPVLEKDWRDREINKQIDDELRKFGSGKITDVGMSCGERAARAEGTSWKAEMEATIRDAASMSSSWEDFVDNMDAAGYTIKETAKNITYIDKANSKRRIRGGTLGDEFTKDGLCYALGWKQSSVQGQPSITPVATESVTNEKNEIVSMPELGQDNNIQVDEDVVKKIESILVPKFNIVASDDNMSANVSLTDELVKDLKIIIPQNQKRPKPLNIHIARYTKSGRRRSDLELIILAAIKIIAYVKDWFQKTTQAPNLDDPRYVAFYRKLETMAQAVNSIQRYSVGTADELKTKMKDVGTQLSTTKTSKENLVSLIDYLEKLEDNYNNAVGLNDVLAKNGLDIKDLYLDQPSKEDIQKANASLQPMTPKLRGKIFYALKNNEQYSLKFGWNEIDKRLSLLDGQKLLKFLQEPDKNEMPREFVETKYEHDKAGSERKYENIRNKKDRELFEKYGNLPLSPEIFKKLKALCNEKGITIDLQTLSMYQGMKIVSYYEQNPFDKTLIDTNQQENLKRLLKDNKLQVTRDVNFVTVGEYEAILKYINNNNLAKPAILNWSKEIRPSSVEQIEELLAMKDEKISIPVEKLTQADANNLFDYLVTRGFKPDIVKSIETSTNREHFMEKIKNLPVDVQQDIIAKREAYQNIVNCGYQLSDRTSIQKQLVDNQKMLKSVEQRLIMHQTNYSELKALAKCVHLANDVTYTHGVNFDKTRDERCDITYLNHDTDIPKPAYDAVQTEEEKIDNFVKAIKSKTWDTETDISLQVPIENKLNASYITSELVKANAKLEMDERTKVTQEVEQKRVQEEQNQEQTSTRKIGMDITH